ncbi:sulfite reductase hemoprotein [Botrytis cinerea]
MSFLFRSLENTSNTSSPSHYNSKMATNSGKIRTPEEAVARIAYLSSDVIISVQPAHSIESEFSSHLHRYAGRKDLSLVAANESGVPELQTIRENNDPLLSVFTPIRNGKLVTVTTSSSILVSSVPHLYRLANFPVVIHVSLQPSQYPDYSSITSIRNSGFTFLQSETLQEAQDIAVTAHALAIKSGKGVIHFFDSRSAANDEDVDFEDPNVVSKILNIDSVRVFQSSKIGGSSIYADDGRIATISENVATGITSGGENSTESAVPGQTTTEVPSKASSVGSSKSSSVRASSVDSSASSATTVDAPNARTVSSDDIYNFVSGIWDQLKLMVGREYAPFQYTGPSNAENALFIFGSDVGLFGRAIDEGADEVFAKAGIITARLYRPWLGSKLIEAIPRSIKRIAVLEQIRRKTTKWGPLLLDLLTTLKSGPGGGVEVIVGHQLGFIEPDTVRQALRGVVQNLVSEKPVQNLEVGNPDGPSESSSGPALSQPKVESAYMKILDQVFGKRLHLANQIDSQNAGISSSIASNPEFGFGSLLARKEHRQRFTEEIKEAAQSKEFITEAPKSWLSKWSASASDDLADEIIARLETDGSALSRSLLSKKGLFRKESPWLVGSDAWAYDLGNSGVHHVIASGENVNMLIIDSTPYSERSAADAERRKKDIGLYAMNFGNAYVASVAVYSSYTQVLQAMIEADQFNGPSVVVAYLPYFKENDSPLTVLQETKKAVDLGYWPLYRWNPDNEEKGEVNFSLDSERIKKELKDFLARDNHLTQLMKKHPQFSSNLSEDYGTEVRALQKRKAKDAYNELLEGMLGAPLTILFASDNGNAESLSKRLGNRGKARGLKTIVMAMEDYPIEDLPTEENIVFLTSTAGQGEFPQNGHAFWESIKDNTDLDLASVNYSVFALGDSHYWPRKEDRHYYNKPGKDLDRVLANLGGKRLADVGLGDDQDPDGYQTGYQNWEPIIWQSLGVDKVEGLEPEAPPITNEDIKIESNYLRGTIEEGLKDMSTMAISAADQQLTKFHGTYMQDDRDLRDERKAQGLEPAYSFMIRCRLAGGVATPKQWIQMDDVSNEFGNETMKLTTRQTFQFHGVIKTKLKGAMRGINKSLMTTIAACGDVNRNVMCSSLPTGSKYHKQVHAISKKISDHLLPSTTAYHEIWIKDEDDKKVQVAGEAVQDYEPLYGPTYLPRKFKITIAIPPHNDTDVYAHDVGLIAIKGEDGNLAGFNLLVGGGMGVTHNNKKTYPRTGSNLGYVSKEQAHIACEKVMLVQRDHGDRQGRRIMGQKFEKAKPFKFQSNIDTFGWVKDETGLNHFTLFIENGRIEDTADFPMKTGLREVAKVHKGEFRLTGNQHLILSNVADEDLPTMKEMLAKYKLDNVSFSGMRLSSSACVAFPTCGLAMAESERYLPQLITKLEGVIEENGMRQDSIVMRMTGCPNGCARPWLAEVAFVGKAYGAYNISSIKEEEILEIMKPLLKRYSLEREEGEHFGDFCIRIGMIKETTEGKTFHDDVAEEESDEE